MKERFTITKGFFPWLVFLTCLLSSQAEAGQPPFGAQQKPSERLLSTQLPLAFEPTGENGNQYIARGPNFLGGFDGKTMHLAIAAPVVDRKHGHQGKGEKTPTKPSKHASASMELLEGNSSPVTEALEPLPGVANYIIGNDPAQWRLGVRTFAKVLYHSVYPGIDVAFYGSERQLEYDFILQPGADPQAIRLKWHGCKQLALDLKGNLRFTMVEGGLIWKKPIAYQAIGGLRKEVACDFVLTGSDLAGFSLGPYDSSLPLTIDPVLIYSTYLGGSNLDAVGEAGGTYPAAGAIALDSNGSVYVTGRTLSTNFFRTNAFRSTPAGNNDLFVTKLNSNGTAVVFSTYLGGSGEDFGYGIAVDSSRNIYLTGSTDSPNFPRTNAFQASLSGTLGYSDSFLVKLNPGGTDLLYATYFGADAIESGNAIAVDNAGNAYIGGDTYSEANFPKTTTRFQSLAGGSQDGFVAKFNTTLSGAASLVYASWLGGSDDDRVNGIAIDSSGNAYVAGETYHYDSSTASDFPVSNALYPTFGGGISDGFIAKINPSGSAKVFCTFIGGAGDDYGWDIGVDSANNVYVVGETGSTNFVTTAGGAQTNFGFGFTDGYFLKLSSNGLSLMYSTFLGGTLEDSATALAVDPKGIAYITGYTISINYPVTPDGFRTSSQGQQDAFLSVVNPALTGPISLVYSTYFGGPNDEQGMGVAVDSAGSAYISGTTSSGTNFPTTPGALQTNYGGGSSDAFITRFETPYDLAISQFSSSPSPVTIGSNLLYTIVVTNLTRNFFTNVTVTNRISAGMTFVSAASSRGSCTQSGGLVTCALGTLTNNTSAIITINVTPTSAGTASSIAGVASPQVERDFVNNLATNSTLVRGYADLAVSIVASPATIYASSNTVLTLTVTNPGPSAASSIVLSNVMPTGLDVVSIQPSQGSCSLAGSLVTCGIPSLAAGTKATVVITSIGATPGTWATVAGISAAEFDPASVNNSASVNVTVNALADLSVVQKITPNPALVGSNISCVITVSNNGPSTANGVVLTNTLSAGLNLVSVQQSQGSCVPSAGSVFCTLGALDSNGLATVTLTLQAVNVGSKTITSGVSAGTADLKNSNNVSVSNLLITVPADLRIAMTANLSSPYLSSNITFTITVTNDGPSSATGVMLQDTLSSALEFVSVQSSQGSCAPAGQSINCNIGALNTGSGALVILTARAVSVQNATNLAVVAAAESDPNLANNSASVIVAINSLADLILSQSISPNPVFAGSNVVCTVTISNAGPSSATAVTLDNALSQGLGILSVQASQGGCSVAAQGVNCNLGTLASNASATVVLILRANGAGSQTIYSDTQSAVSDPALANNAILGNVTVTPIADLRVSMTGNPTVQAVNGNVTYSIVLTNFGPSVASSVILQDTLPAGVGIVSVQTSQGACSQSGQTVNCNVGSLPSGVGVGVTVIVQGTSASTVTNLVQASSSVADPNTADNIARVSTTFQNLPVLAIGWNGTNVAISWPTNSVGFSLQYRTNLNTGNSWYPTAETPRTVGTLNVVTNGLGGPLKLYRLIK
ncbi:MAG: uncharacterized protein JWM16_6226 [Verrucomicrobiales bacterium]|nr:uncharacterized protein [Verrucomicrobiales bacterium]